MEVVFVYNTDGKIWQLKQHNQQPLFSIELMYLIIV